MFVDNDGMKTRNDPMVWWKTRNTIYPRWFFLAKRRFVLIMNSVACERIFSKMDLMISSRNIHTLVYIFADVRTFGPLPNFSAYIFEKYHGKLRRLVKKIAAIPFNKL
jgi:hAT family C-terminal dimerisation region